MMIITCPLCGAELESDVDIAIGQHVVCSFCERKFTYGADEASDAENADVSAAEAMHEDEFPDRFCWKCGAEIPPDSVFCPACGQDLRTKEDRNADVSGADSFAGNKHPFEGQLANTGKFHKMIFLLWMSVVILALSILFGVFDVREYYSLGKVGYFLFSASCLAIDVWLIRALMHRKSWARKAFIALTSISVICTLVDGFNLSFAVFLDWVSLLIGVYCVYLCFSREVANVFDSDARSQGANAIVNRIDCIAFIIVLLMSVALGGVWSYVRHGTESWAADCWMAVGEGSSSAKREMIEFMANLAAEKFPEERIEDLVANATKVVDETIGKNHSRGGASDFGNVTREVARHPARGVVLLKILKGIGIAIAAIFAFVGGLFSKKK